MVSPGWKRENGPRSSPAAGIEIHQFGGIKASVGDVAAPPAGDAHLAQQPAPLLEDEDAQALACLCCGEGAEKASWPTANHNQVEGFHIRDHYLITELIPSQGNDFKE